MASLSTRVGGVLAATTVLVGVTAGAYWLGYESVPATAAGPAGPTTGVAATASAQQSAAPTEPDASTGDIPVLEEDAPSTEAATPDQLAVDAASGWIRARATTNWRDPSPYAWVDNVRPYVTEELAATYAASVAAATEAASAAVGWSDFVARECAATAVDVDAGIPPEATSSDTVRHVEIAATVITECNKGFEPGTWAYGARLQVIRVEDGRWLVSQELA